MATAGLKTRSALNDEVLDYLKDISQTLMAILRELRE